MNAADRAVGLAGYTIAMLEFQSVRLRRGPQVLIDAASFTLFGGDKVGIVGRNGCGKSTLLALVRGELGCDAGEFTCSSKLRIVSVLQELPRTESTVLDYIMDGDVDVRRVERAIEVARSGGDGVREAALHAEFESLAGYAAPARASETAVGLGFAQHDLTKPLGTLSGGLQMRANLARALLGRADVLLLDEPTNHLDLDAVLWLERWLQRFRGTLLLVSHDREFLDAVVARIVHIESGQVHVYEGNYGAYERQAAAERQRVATLAERQAHEAARIHSFVERFRAKASKARQVQSRLKWLSRLEELPPERTAETFEWRFESARKLPQPLLTFDSVSAGYGARTVLANVRLDLNPGDRLGILGRNGAGKSTLMKTIAGEIRPHEGSRLPAADLVVGFFAQMELDRFEASDTAMAALVRRVDSSLTTGSWSEQQRRDHLGRFGFRGDRVFEPVECFSGGERARLALALLVAERPNLLLLDEPTNHLDFEMRHALAMALQEYAGAVVIVSHDRSLLRAVCDRLVIVHDGMVTPFDGDLEDYARWLDSADRDTREPTACESRVTEMTIGRREQRRHDADARKQLAPLKQELRQLEAQLAILGRERVSIEERLADAALYATTQGSQTARELTIRSHAIARETAELEERWLSCSLALEAAQQSATE